MQRGAACLGCVPSALHQCVGNFREASAHPFPQLVRGMAGTGGARDGAAEAAVVDGVEVGDG